MLHILLGEDDFSRSQALEQLKNSLGDRANLVANTVALEGEKVTPDQLRGACETVPFLAEKRLVIIDGLLERFEPKGKSGQKKRPSDQKEERKQDELKTLAESLTHLPGFTTVVLVSGKIGNRNPLLAELSGKADVRAFPLMKEPGLKLWIERRVKEAGGSVSPNAVSLLVRFVGGNLWIMANEIDKLRLFTGGRRIEEKDVRAMVSDAQQANVFAMVDAMLEARAEVAGPLLQKLLQWGAAPNYLLVMLARQAQLIVRAKDLNKQGISRAELQGRLGLPSEFALRKTLEQANRYSLRRLREVYRHLLEADLSIKTGQYDGELALDLLVTELCQK
ncbi:MAG: DNA polymerase III subunit delta [Chloroflexi bacterium]|nr:DNA polymerase III subunit delta [Chloroflexota bacterium]